MPLVAKINTPEIKATILRIMKRKTILLVLVAFLCSVGFAQDFSSANMNYRFVSGGFWSCGQDISGGYGEFGINCQPEEKVFVMRDCLFIQGEGGTLRRSSSAHPDPLEFGGAQIGNKLILGARTNGPGFIVRCYGFASVSAELFSCSGHDFFSLPLMINLTFGGGFEFQYHRSAAFVLEFGGRNILLAGGDKLAFEGYSFSSPVFTIGFRSFN